MTNNSVFSRRACVEKVQILPDGSIPTVEMTSLGFEESLSPYKPVKAEIACVLIGGCFVTEKDLFRRVVTQITEGCIIGYKYFDFGDDYSTKTMELAVKITGMGCKGKLHVLIDGTETEIAEFQADESEESQEHNNEVLSAGLPEVVEYSSLSKGKPGKEIGVIELGLGDGIYRGRVQNVTGRHALYFKADIGLPKGAWTSSFFDGRVICELEEFVFLK